jgi:hypothetical protein
MEIFATIVGMIIYLEMNKNSIPEFNNEPGKNGIQVLQIQQRHSLKTIFCPYNSSAICE